MSYHRWFILAVFAALLATLPSEADVVILKDGFTLHGKATREMGTIIDDRTGEALISAKAAGFHVVDDGPRYTIYSAHSRRVGDVDNQIDIRKGLMRIARNSIRGTTEFPNGCRLSEFTEFDKDWKRTFRATNPRGYTIVTQQIGSITPYYMFLTSSHKFTTWYRTDEIGPERVGEMLRNHPDLMEEPGMPEFEKRLKLFDFYLQAKWYDAADRMTKTWIDDFPTERKRIDEAKLRLRNLQAEFLVEQVEIARTAGRHRWAQEQLKRFPDEGLEAETLDQVAKLRAQYETNVTQFDEVRRHLRELSGQLEGAETLFLAQAAAAILSELHIDNMDRVETFLAQAEQSENDRKKGRKPVLGAPELLSLAVTGWLQGKNAAEGKVDAALRLWRAREKVLTYMNTSAAGLRVSTFESYLQDKNPLAFDEMAQMLAFLPPVEAETTTTSTEEAFERTTPSLPGHNSGVEFLLSLPPEYQHGRPYPVLMALHNASEQPKAMIARLKPYADRYGYILVAPKWSPGLGGGYGYTDEEQTAVTGVLSHVKRLVQCDSDRVFLCGLGDGATLAFDVGVSTPDLFAGILPMGPPPSWTGLMLEYWRNAQLLPYYVVMGNLTGESWKSMRRILEMWMPKGYPALTVLYKGRGYEWFSSEVPVMFDWMNRKKRAEPWRELGAFDQEFRTARQSNNRFYWLTTNEIKDRHLIENRRGGQSLIPARLSAKVVNGNNIFVTTFGLKQVTVLLSRQIVDFDRPVQITVNNRVRWNNGGKPLKPDIHTMMEDFYERNDRQRLYFYKVEFENPEGR